MLYSEILGKSTEPKRKRKKTESEKQGKSKSEL